MSAKRDRLEIINDILVSIQGKGGKIKPTHLLYKSNLSYVKMKEYLDELMKNNMVFMEEEGKNKFYLITDKGHQFVSEFGKIKKFSESFGL